MKRSAFGAMAVAVAFSGFSGCGAPPQGATTGTAVFRFAATSDVKTSANLKDPLQGTFYGDIFLQEDVSVTGPRKDAQGFQSLEVPAIDLRTTAANEPGAAELTSAPLPPGKYVVLGFFDLDGNGSSTGEPDPGDPVTLALTNTFDIVAGAQTKRLVLFELVFN